MNKMAFAKDSDDLESESDQSIKLEDGNKILNKMNGQKDPLFFEFFSIYTAQSVKQTSRR